MRGGLGFNVFRWLRFWARRPLLLNASLFVCVWVLYGTLEVHTGAGATYARRSHDLCLASPDDVELFSRKPGIENVLLPGIASVINAAYELTGANQTDRIYLVLAVLPYAAFIYLTARHLGTRRHDPLLALAATAALYTSGLIPYMASWPGYVDGLGYLLLLPAFIYADSIVVFSVVLVLQCLNHYLGAVALLVFAGVWQAAEGLDRAGEGRLDALSCFVKGLLPRLVIGMFVLGAFNLLWGSHYPAASGVRSAIAIEKWNHSGGTFDEVFNRIPFTVLSGFKLTLVPLVLFGLARPQTHRTLWGLVLALPFALASLLTIVFVDVTRVATMLTLPVIWLLITRLQRRSTLEHVERRRLRRTFLAAALLNLCAPNYIVNNGEIVVPDSHALHSALQTIGEGLTR